MNWCEYTGNCPIATEFIDNSFEFYLTEKSNDLEITNLSYKSKCNDNHETCQIRKTKLNLKSKL